MSGASMLSGPLCSVAAITLLAATAASAGQPVGAVAQSTADGPSAASTWMPINNPLFLESFLERHSEDDVLRFSYIVHCALDAIEERVTVSKRPTLGQAADPYLGLLYPTEDYRIYGYISNTKVKLVLVIAMNAPNFKDDELIAVFRRLHAAYVDAVSNPFYTIGQPITSRQFAVSVKTAVELFNVSLA